uniref:hypothetical protein n=1 Tax=Microcystis aeruginosa TaxID=1126 RepID=UPI0018662D4B|nr:hypothetical protein [Microcystis aeruginosa]
MQRKDLPSFAHLWQRQVRNWLHYWWRYAGPEPVALLAMTSILLLLAFSAQVRSSISDHIEPCIQRSLGALFLRFPDGD